MHLTQLSTCTTPLCDSLGLFITVLQLAQFVPQHYEMAVDRSAVGVSPWLLFFSSLYTYLAALDTLLLALPTLSCSQTTFRCFMAQQPLIQMTGSALLSITMWYWYLKFHHDATQITDPAERRLSNSFFYTALSAHAFYDAFVAISVAAALLAAALGLRFGLESSVVLQFAYACGSISAVLNALMWLPQIVVTAQYGHKGALSLPWVAASLVMDIAYTLYLAALGTHWSVWINNVPDGVQTAILLVMLVYFESRDERDGVDDYGHPIHDLEDAPREDENTVLLKG